MTFFLQLLASCVAFVCGKAWKVSAARDAATLAAVRVALEAASGAVMPRRLTVN